MRDPSLRTVPRFGPIGDMSNFHGPNLSWGEDGSGAGHELEGNCKKSCARVESTEEKGNEVLVVGSESVVIESGRDRTVEERGRRGRGRIGE